MFWMDSLAFATISATEKDLTGERNFCHCINPVAQNMQKLEVSDTIIFPNISLKLANNFWAYWRPKPDMTT